MFGLSIVPTVKITDLVTHCLLCVQLPLFFTHGLKTDGYDLGNMVTKYGLPRPSHYPKSTGVKPYLRRLPTIFSPL
jgi:hypothetical protein